MSTAVILVFDAVFFALGFAAGSIVARLRAC
jgi:hypothetical protein